MACWSDRVDSMGQTKNTSFWGVFVKSISGEIFVTLGMCRYWIYQATKDGGYLYLFVMLLA